MTEIAVMLGGNLPGSAEVIKEALKKFAAAGVEDICTSEVKISEAVDCVPGTPDFLDMAFAGKWAGTEVELLELCQRLEREAGRPAIHSSRESRILDCDIIFFGDDDIPDDLLNKVLYHLNYERECVDKAVLLIQNGSIVPEFKELQKLCFPPADCRILQCEFAHNITG